MSDATKTFTREELVDHIVLSPKPSSTLAAFALTLLDRAERAERGLREAEEAIQKAREYVRTAIARRQPGYIADEYANEFLRAYNKLPAVRRALDRKGEG